nr:MAG TPA_asm: hypothetical protein [Caudoviricetes sp.]
METLPVPFSNYFVAWLNLLNMWRHFGGKALKTSKTDKHLIILTLCF